MPLTEQEKQAVQNAKSNPQSLYSSLHLVGDDYVKADIEEALQELLPPEHFQIVLAVFQVGTSPDSDSSWEPLRVRITALGSSRSRGMLQALTTCNSWYSTGVRTSKRSILFPSLQSSSSFWGEMAGTFMSFSFR